MEPPFHPTEPPPPPLISLDTEAGPSWPIVPAARLLSRGSQVLLQSLERNRSVQGNPDLAKVLGASIFFQED